MGMLYFETKDYNTALIFFIKGFLIFSKLGSPNANIIKHKILEVKEKTHGDQFNEIAKQFALPPGVYDSEEDGEDPKEKAIQFVKTITYEAVYAKERSIEGKEKLVAKLKSIIEHLSDAPESERIKFYFQMLLAYVTGKDYLRYMKELPIELVDIFKKNLGEIK
jgi:CRISPR/Cas system CSM-associated protein Csm2 small subunit